ncbi:MAG TPA: sigma-70 family RNA polymerase sigma factor [Puia sp.]|nr:sigma-70 family RNA polymerase sigma factor [Puia sp.]
MKKVLEFQILLNESQHTDLELIRQMATGSEASFSELYQKYWERLYLTASRKLGDKELAKEVVHDVFVDLWKRRLSLTITYLSAYLDKALNNRIINTLISKKDTFFFDILENPQESCYEADSIVLEKDLTALIIAWIEALPEKRRQIFVRYYFQHLTTEEIAEDLQISRKTVQNQLSISTQYLRTRFGHLLTIFILLRDISDRN